MNLTLTEKRERLIACQKIRKIASQTCLITLQQTLNAQKKISEINFKNRWNKELEKNWNKGYVDCWYDPPPDGIAAIFGSDDNFKRINYPTLRTKKNWPKQKSYFRNDGLGYIFASPFTMHNNIPVIGDFGLTYYLGDNKKIREHYKKSYSLLNKLIDKIKPGLKFKDLFRLGSKMIAEGSLENFIVGITDKAKTDFGHTIPFIDRNPQGKEITNLDSGNPVEINRTISETRRFINEFEDYEISNNCAFTFEPRLTNSDKSLPIFSFHRIIQFISGKRVILENFEGIINLLRINWIYS